MRERRSRYYQDNAEKIKAASRRWSQDNAHRKRENRARHYERNRERYILGASEWARRNPDRRREIAAEWSRRERSTPEGKAREACRKMLLRVLSLTGKRKKTVTEKALGYTKAELVAHIESHFQSGMSWDNRGAWHIDHVVPVSELVRLGVSDPKEINKLSNLQPMWADENLSKRDRFELSMSNFQL